MKIEIKNLSKRFESKELFKDYNLTIPSKTITIVMGDSGSGKTTLLNMIGTIEDYDGMIYYDGSSYAREKEKRLLRRNHISFIFQNYGLIDNETVYDNFKVIQNLNKNDQHKIDDALSAVGLFNFGKRKVFELSGGEQQRVAIAKSIVKDSDLILADEPTASIDNENKDLVLKLLNDMNQKGKTIVIVTHDHDIKEYFPQANLISL